MCKYLSDSARYVKKTKVPHICQLCGEEIKIGSSCSRYSVIVDNKMTSCYYHQKEDCINEY